MNKKACLFVALCLIKSLLWAQSEVVVRQKTDNRYHFFNYTSQQGLMQNSILDMAIDEDGFLWLSTWKGISRFDGKHFRSFIDDNIRIKNSAVKSFLKRGQILVMPDRPHHFVQKGLIHYHPKKDHIEGLLTGNNGQFLSSETFRNLEELPLSLKKNETFYKVNDSAIYILRLSLKGETPLRVEYYENGILINEFVPWVFPYPGQPYRRSREIRERAFVHDGCLFIWNKQGGLLRFERGVLTSSYDVPEISDKVYAFWKSGHKPYVHDYGNAKLYSVESDDRGIRLELIVENFRPSGNGILCIIDDPVNDVILIGTEIEGFYRLRKVGFRSLSSKEYPNKNSILGAEFIGKDSVFTNTGILYSAKGNTLFNKDRIRWASRLYKEDEHTIWVLAPVIKFSFKNGKVSYKRSFPGAPKGLSGCFTDVNGRKWCVGNEGIYELKNESFSLVPRTQKGKNARVFYNSKTNEAWIAYPNIKRVFKWKPATAEFEDVKLLEGRDIEQIYFARNDLLFIKITTKRFHVLYNNKLTELTGDPADYLLSGHCVLEDEDENLWFSSDHGLFRTKMNSVLSYLKDTTHTIYYYHYDKSWGFINNEFNGKGCPCSASNNDSTLLFPSLNGVVVFNPLNTSYEKHGNGLAMESIFVDGKETDLTPGFHLAPSFYDLKFKIIQAFYDSRNNVYMDYKLKGYSDQWNKVPISGEVLFTRLPFGNYELIVRKHKGFESDDFIELCFPFTVNKYYYQTYWFIILAVMVLIASVQLLLKWRLAAARRRRRFLNIQIERKTREYKKLNKKLKSNVKKLKKLTESQEESIRIRREMIGIYAHDIRGPLHFIRLIAGKSGEQSGSIPLEILKDYMKTIKDSADGIFNQTEKMFNWNRVQDEELPINFQEIKVKDVINDEVNSLLKQAEEKEIKYIDEIGAEVTLFTEEDLFRIVVNNLFQNAIKYTRGGSIILKTDKTNYSVTLKFIDTGTGIAPEQLQKIKNGLYTSVPGTNKETGKAYGLRVVKDILSRLNAKMDIESEVGKGTTIAVIFKDGVYIS